jgi:transposase
LIRNTELIAPLTSEEYTTLTELSKHHRYPGFQLRGRGLLSLDAGHSPTVVAAVLGKTPQTVYNWAKWWRNEGLAGILGGNKGHPPTKLSSQLLDCAEEIARNEPLTLEAIKQRVLACHPDAPNFSTERLSVGLRKRGWSFKRTRLSLKKTE